MTTHIHDHTHDHDHAHDHSAEMRVAWIKTALLIGLGLYFVWNIASGNLTNYINIRFAWLSYLAAALFLLIGGYSAFRLLTARGHHDHDHHDHGDHQHGQISWGALGIVAVPLVLGTLVPSRPLGAEAVDGTISTTTTANAVGTITTFTTPPLERNVLDWLRVFNMTSDYSELNGLPADVIGFVYSEPTFEDGKFMVARFTVSCCVADASAIGLPTRWEGTDELPQGDWVRVQGNIEVGEFRGDVVPILHATTVQVIPQPDHPYLYP